jgi:hypothetical protein
MSASVTSSALRTTGTSAERLLICRRGTSSSSPDDSCENVTRLQFNILHFSVNATRRDIAKRHKVKELKMKATSRLITETYKDRTVKSTIHLYNKLKS